MSKTFFIKTFGCAQNTADSERIKTYFFQMGYEEADDIKRSNLVVINSCIVRESAENRVYGLINNLKETGARIVLTGCLVGAAYYDKTGKMMRELKKRVPEVDEFLPIDKISFELEPLRDKKKAALVSISSGCDNFCSYCIVPHARGRERSRKFDVIVAELKKVLKAGFKEVVLIGQNVNSYGFDLNNGVSLFPKLLEETALMPFEKVSFVSSNPWDFSDELIEVIAKHDNIDRLVHLPFQSGDDEILKKMNRNYTAGEYLNLVNKIKSKVKSVRFSTDIIVGFPGETEEAFLNTVEVCKKVGFEIAYINKYSPRVGTVSAKLYENDVSQKEKKRRWMVLEKLINQK